MEVHRKHCATTFLGHAGHFRYLGSVMQLLPRCLRQVVGHVGVESEQLLEGLHSQLGHLHINITKNVFFSVFRIHRIHVFLSLPDPDPDPSIIKQI
jgi:hypothetical protein